VAAVAAQATGVAGRFHHDAVLGGDTPSLVGVGGYALAWTVMVTAMMRPSALPLLRLFVETSAGQGRRGRCWPASPPGTGRVGDGRVGGPGLRRRRPRHGRRPGLLLGAGCLVMFSVGVADLGWMAALALAALVALHPSWMPPGHGRSRMRAGRGRRARPRRCVGVAGTASTATGRGPAAGRGPRSMRRIAVDHAASLAGVLGG
jgi:hypothetical protein